MREPVMSEHAKRLLRWRESFLHLEENRFFEVMRMYLGEIKTPYNKQKLIESLEGFFRKKDNLVVIKSFLTKEEIEIINAVVFIPDATEEKLYSFFENTYSYSFLYETLLNLEERLIIFKSAGNSLDSTRMAGYHIDGRASENLIFELNPLLEEAFYDLISVKTLLPQIEFKKGDDSQSVITQEFIACFVSYVFEHPNIAKQDGTLKKHALESAQEIFGANASKISVLYNAFLNLGILKESLRGVDFDFAKLNDFVNENFFAEVIYIIVASSGHFSRDNLRVQAQLFIDTLVNLGDACFTKDLFLRTGFLVAARPRVEARGIRSGAESGRGAGSDRGAGLGAGAGLGDGGSRFSRILEEGRARLAGKSDEEAMRVSTSGGLERMFEAAVLLGVVTECGKLEKDVAVYCVVRDRTEVQKPRALDDADAPLKGMLSIDAAMDVSLMPGYPVSKMIPVMKFLSLKHYDTVSSFAISRQSVMRGFDTGLSSVQIIELLQERTSYQIPETLLVQLEEWNSSYSSAAVFKGYVFKAEGKAALVAEHNSNFASHIHTKIAPGIYLLDVNSDEELQALIKESGLDFVGKIKTASQQNMSAGFLPLNIEGRIIDDKHGFEKPKEEIAVKDPEQIEKELFAKIDELELDNEQRESLELRVIHKVIVNASQLDARVLRLARVNASAMDFGGKVYVIEQAVKNGESVELSFNGGKTLVLGQPVGIQKRNDEAYVQLMLMPEKIVREFALGKADAVKRIRKSIYRE